MIYTVTFNPSLDYIVTLQNMEVGTINRTTKELLYPGGKGMNVSMVLRNLDYESTALGFLAGFTGAEIERLLRLRGIHTDLIHVKEGISRINVKIRAQEETEINGMGPVISEDDIKILYNKLDTLKEDDILVLAGSIPASMPETIYRDILKHLDGRGIRIVVDATKDLLTKVLPYHPFLVKPNHKELGEIYGVTLDSREAVIPYARKLQELGGRNILVSMAEAGAVLLTESGEVFQEKAPFGTLVNSVGAGDSMVAGFLAGYMRTSDYERAFYLGLCAGSASAFSEGMAEKEQIRALLSQFHRSLED